MKECESPLRGVFSCRGPLKHGSLKCGAHTIDFNTISRPVIIIIIIYVLLYVYDE